MASAAARTSPDANEHQFDAPTEGENWPLANTLD
jgi:hypothetical protein